MELGKSTRIDAKTGTGQRPPFRVRARVRVGVGVLVENTKDHSHHDQRQ